MPSIPCPDCGHRMSITADRCPGCGSPTRILGTPCVFLPSASDGRGGRPGIALLVLVILLELAAYVRAFGVQHRRGNRGPLARLSELRDGRGPLTLYCALEQRGRDGRDAHGLFRWARRQAGRGCLVRRAARVSPSGSLWTAESRVGRPTDPPALTTAPHATAALRMSARRRPTARRWPHSKRGINRQALQYGVDRVRRLRGVDHDVQGRRGVQRGVGALEHVRVGSR